MSFPIDMLFLKPEKTVTRTTWLQESAKTNYKAITFLQRLPQTNQ